MDAVWVVLTAAAVTWIAASWIVRIRGPRGRFTEGDSAAAIAVIDRHLVRGEHGWGTEALRLAPVGVTIRPVPSTGAPVVTIRSRQIDVLSQMPEEDLRHLLSEAGYGDATVERTLLQRSRSRASIPVVGSRSARRRLAMGLDVHRALGSHTTDGVWKWKADYPTEAGGA